MEEEKNQLNQTQPPISTDERLKSLAEKSGISVEEFLNDLEEKQTVNDTNIESLNQSVGSQSKNAQDFFDPASTEFLKGLWGK